MPEAISPTIRRGYALGGVATGAFGTVPGLLLLPYLTDIIGIGPAIAGLIVFAPKVWDVLADPIVGRISDRHVSERGRRRPFLLWGGCFLAVSFALLFMGPTGSTLWGGIYVVAVFLVCATAFTCFQVPYVAMPAEMTQDYHERTKLMTWRVIVLSLAILCSGGLAPLLVNAFGGEPTAAGYQTMGVFIGGLIIAGALGAYFSTARATLNVTPSATGSLLAQLRTVAQVADFRSLLMTFMAQAVSVGAVLAAVAYASKDVLETPIAATLLFLGFVAPAIIVTPWWQRVAEQRGKLRGYVLASFTMLIGMTSLTVIATGSLLLTCLASAVVGVGYAGAQAFPLAMLPDVAGHDALKTGRNRIGVFTGLWTAGETLGMALGAALFASVLALGGYISSAQGETVTQPDSALAAIVLGFSIIPALLIALSLVTLRRYTLDRSAYEQSRTEQQSGPGIERR